MRDAVAGLLDCDEVTLYPDGMENAKLFEGLRGERLDDDASRIINGERDASTPASLIALLFDEFDCAAPVRAPLWLFSLSAREAEVIAGREVMGGRLTPAG